MGTQDRPVETRVAVGDALIAIGEALDRLGRSLVLSGSVERGSDVQLVPPGARLMSMSEAAQRLGVPKGSAYKLAYRDEFPVPAFKMGGRWMVRSVHVEELLGGRPLSGVPLAP
jgi:hypothetical protein